VAFELPIFVVPLVSWGLPIFSPRLRVVGKRVRVAGDHLLAHWLNKDRGYYTCSICAFINFVSLTFPLWSGKVVYGHIVEVGCGGRNPGLGENLARGRSIEFDTHVSS